MNQEDFLYLFCTAIFIFIPLLSSLFREDVLKRKILFGLLMAAVIGAYALAINWLEANPGNIFLVIFASASSGSILKIIFRRKLF